jgi:hypothetical protein
MQKLHLHVFIKECITPCSKHPPTHCQRHLWYHFFFCISNRSWYSAVGKVIAATYIRTLNIKYFIRQLINSNNFDSMIHYQGTTCRTRCVIFQPFHHCINASQTEIQQSLQNRWPQDVTVGSIKIVTTIR